MFDIVCPSNYWDWGQLGYVFRIYRKLEYNFLNIKDKTRNKKSSLKSEWIASVASRC